MKALCERYNVPFFINDNVEIAVKCKADGIHVGQELQESNPRVIIIMVSAFPEYLDEVIYV